MPKAFYPPPLPKDQGIGFLTRPPVAKWLAQVILPLRSGRTNTLWMVALWALLWGCTIPTLPPDPLLCQQDDDCNVGQLCQQGQCVVFFRERSPSDASHTEPVADIPPACLDGQTKPCSQDGACSGGVSICKQGRWEPCRPAQPTPELCNGKDDDCDGQIDNNLRPPLCNLQKGVCAGSAQVCGGSKGWLDCDLSRYNAHNSDYQATEESCDGKDNDCDGIVDPAWLCGCKAGDRRACYNGPGKSRDLGSCRAGYQLCQDGQWGPCQEERLPSREVCDGKDNNCDGRIDETDPNLDQPCVIPKANGPCQQGTMRCRDGVLLCQVAYIARPEICNGKDDDCNGKIDEGCR
ncbi:hypothetical protein L6R29_10375 [Myxococcota bacterium]|nr:hypothetical protein [Myxococcota bacterium]